MWGGLRAAKPGCEGAFLCGIVRGVVEFLMGGGVRAVKVRPDAPRYLMKKSQSSLQYYRLELSLAVGSTHAGQGEMRKGRGTPLGTMVCRVL